MKPSLAVLAATLGVAAMSHAAEITVLSGGAVKTAFTAAAAAWQQRTGHKVSATFAPAGEMRKKVGAGEVTDVLIVPSENLGEYEKSGAIVASSRKDLAVVSMGVAVRKGAAVPDISTPEALKRVLIEARSLTYMDPARGTSGKHFDEAVLPKLGIRDEVRAKTRFGEGGFIAEKVARGEVELVFHQMTEMLPVPGITIVGPLPRELQKETVYSAVIMKGAKNPDGARALLDYLVSAEGRKAFLDRGFAAPN